MAATGRGFSGLLLVNSCMNQRARRIKDTGIRSLRDWPAQTAFKNLYLRGWQPSRTSHATPVICSKNAPANSEEILQPRSMLLERDAVAIAASKVAPAVVTLDITVLGSDTGYQEECSGTIIDKDGWILTCAHVFNDPKKDLSSDFQVTVTLQDGQTLEGEIMGVDFDFDIAVVKINRMTPFQTAKLGSSSKLRPGEWVAAMGSPLCLKGSVTLGIVSYAHRKNSELGLKGVPKEYIQTDCAINEGNSGGPLFNLDGEVVGVNVRAQRHAHTMSFAVPVDSVSHILSELMRIHSSGYGLKWGPTEAQPPSYININMYVGPSTPNLGPAQMVAARNIHPLHPRVMYPMRGRLDDLIPTDTKVKNSEGYKVNNSSLYVTKKERP